MVEKRAFMQEETFEVSKKHQRQDCSTQLTDFGVHEDASRISANGGDGRLLKADTGYEGKPVSFADNELELVGNVESIDANAVGCASSNSGWGTSSTSEEDSWSEEPVHIPFFPDYFHPERPARTLAHWEDVYSLLLEQPPRKTVPIGGDYQADIPACGLVVSKRSSYDVQSSDAADREYEEVQMRTCIAPMPDFDSDAYTDDKVGKGRVECSCEDRGSLRCVRQHIMERRENLRLSLGEKSFGDLGFYEMGEVVADKWSEEEEYLFHKIVYSNPVSFGRNFWINLSAAFPSRTNKDIVSYYFNSFMLRRRADQNRCESMSIDSDNDERQGSLGSVDGEIVMSDEDEDSVVESPECQTNIDGVDDSDNALHVFDEDGVDDNCENHESADSNYQMSKRGYLDSVDPTSVKVDKVCCDEQGENEARDDSCTSSDTGSGSLEAQINAENGYWHGNLNSCGNGNGYLLESSDANVWDAVHVTSRKDKIDFLPTCSVIEEVFGDDGSWNCKFRDGKGSLS